MGDLSGRPRPDFMNGIIQVKPAQPMSQEDAEYTADLIMKMIGLK